MPLMQFLKGTFVQQTVATTLLLTFAEHIRPTPCLKANFQTCTRDLIKAVLQTEWQSVQGCS